MPDAPRTPDRPDEATAPSGDLDPATLKDALGRTGRMLKTAGLPFEEDEFAGEDETPATSEADRT